MYFRSRSRDRALQPIIHAGPILPSLGDRINFDFRPRQPPDSATSKNTSLELMYNFFRETLQLTCGARYALIYCAFGECFPTVYDPRVSYEFPMGVGMLWTSIDGLRSARVRARLRDLAIERRALLKYLCVGSRLQPHRLQSLPRTGCKLIRIGCGLRPPKSCVIFIHFRDIRV